MLAELQELTSPQSHEVSAVAVGLLACLIIGLCIVFGYLFHAMVKASPYDETSGPLHPADDVHNPDIWDLAEEYRRDNPERAYFPREGK